MSDSQQFDFSDKLEVNFSTQKLLLILVALVAISTTGGVVLSMMLQGTENSGFPGVLVLALALVLVAFLTFTILKGVQALRNQGIELINESPAPLLDTASDPLSKYYRSALGNTSGNIMIANANNIIVYMNEAVSRLFKEHEEAIRKQLPDFNAQYLVGSCMDDFHKNPDHQRDLIQNLEQTYEAQADIADITFSIIANPIFDDSGERLGTVVEWQDISDELAARRQARENSRLSQALDSASANIMVADADNMIIYMNNTVRQMFRKAESDIRQDLPHFNVDKLIGQSMDVFHKNPDHQRKLINSLTSTYTAPEARVANRVFKITASPIFEKDGARLGTVVEWQDISAELAVEHEISSIVESARHGDLGKRISTDDKSGFFNTLAAGINDLVAVSDRIVSDTGSFLSALAQGDLRQRMEGDYKGAFEQLKKDANATVERLIEVLGDIQNSSQSVATGADEISKGNLNLSQRTEEQSASLEETAASMEQMTATVQQNAENAQLASTLAVEAKGQAEHGGEVVSNAITAMEEINDASQKIEAIISVIDEIAYQTNLLALNASVEAARAGEQGRGFAVVAEEVRSLAGRSAEAAKEIKELIENSSQKVKDGSTLVHSSGETLNEIIEAVGKVSSIISEISIASSEQATGIEEVNRAITQMDEITQQNAALVEESATAAQSMSDQAGDLRRLVEFFKMK